MSAILRIYDKITSPTNASICITATSTAFTLYQCCSFKQYLDNPLMLTISACAGGAIALLVNTYLVHNAEVKNKGERNTVYATCSLMVGFMPVKDTVLYNNIYSYAVNIFAHFGQYPHPRNYLHGLEAGFLLTHLLMQLKEVD